MTCTIYILAPLAIKKKEEKCNEILTHIGNKLSLYIYVLHGAVISITSLLEELCFGKAENIIFSWIKPVIVIIGSVLGAEIFYLSSTKIRRKERKKNE